MTLTPLQQHRKKWEDCQRCPLRDQRSRVVICRGQIPCSVLFLGEAPGVSEDLTGQPFVGLAGHYLDGMIEEAMPLDADGRPRLRVAFTNVAACFPREAKESGDGDHRPPVEAIKACAPRVREFAAIARPRLVVCVGDTAKTWVHLGIDAASESVRIVHVMHPAAMLGNRMPHAQKGLARDRVVTVLAEEFEKLLEGDRCSARA